MENKYFACEMDVCFKVTKKNESMLMSKELSIICAYFYFVVVFIINCGTKRENFMLNL